MWDLYNSARTAKEGFVESKSLLKKKTLKESNSTEVIKQSYIFNHIVDGFIPAGEIYKKIGYQKYKELDLLLKTADEYVKGKRLDITFMSKFDAFFPIVNGRTFFSYLKDYAKELTKHGFKRLELFLKLNLSESKMKEATTSKKTKPLAENEKWLADSVLERVESLADLAGDDDVAKINDLFQWANDLADQGYTYANCMRVAKYVYKVLVDKENNGIKTENKQMTKIEKTIALLEKVSGKKVTLVAKEVKPLVEAKEDKKEDKKEAPKKEEGSAIAAATANADEPILGNIIPPSVIKQMDAYVSDTLAEIDKSTTQLRAIKRQIASGSTATSEDFSTLTERIAFLVKQLSRIALYSSNTIKAGKFDKNLLDKIFDQKELTPTSPLTAPMAPADMGVPVMESVKKGLVREAVDPSTIKVGGEFTILYNTHSDQPLRVKVQTIAPADKTGKNIIHVRSQEAKYGAQIGTVYQVYPEALSPVVPAQPTTV